MKQKWLLLYFSLKIKVFTLFAAACPCCCWPLETVGREGKRAVVSHQANRNAG